MDVPVELLLKIQKDYNQENIFSNDFEAYVAGYIACLKRFGGNNGTKKNSK